MGLLDAGGASETAAWDLTGRVVANRMVSAGLWRLDLALPREVPFLPGQFAMLLPAGRDRSIFRRPFSILAGEAGRMAFLYRVVGRGTDRLARMRPGEEVDCLAPLGRPFPEPGAAGLPVLLLAGGVGLPPLHAWLARYGRAGDLACFGARDGADAPWPLLPAPWRVSVDGLRGLPPDRSAHHGPVTDLARHILAAGEDAAADRRLVLACGPLPLLRAAAILAHERDWPCLVSLEEHMGCGYGVCKGCVVPVLTNGPDGWRHANCCSEGPVFDAAALDWQRLGAPRKDPA